MKTLNECKLWLESRADLFKDLVRMYLGVGLFVKGLYFMAHRPELDQLLSDLDSLAFGQAIIAHAVIPIHVVGGLLLAIGLLTRFAALLHVPLLMGAVFYVHLPRMALVEPRQSLEFSALVLFLLVLLSIYGAGRFSVDHLLKKKETAQMPAPSAA